jgi:hypothetical protein
MRGAFAACLLAAVLLAGCLETQPVQNTATYVGSFSCGNLNDTECAIARENQNTIDAQTYLNSRAGQAVVYPKAQFTPGHAKATIEAVVCGSSYIADNKDVYDVTKRLVFKNYNITYPNATVSDVIIDHFIPVGLGGSNDDSNLWPQYETAPGFHEKDAAENYLRGEVCSGRMQLEEAQSEIQSDWYKVYQDMKANGVTIDSTGVEDVSVGG